MNWTAPANSISVTYQAPQQMDEGQLLREMWRNNLSALGVVATDDTIDVWFSSALDDDQLAVSALVVSAHDGTEQDLQRVKYQRAQEIDRRTDELIAAGFDFAGQRFSMSLNAQSRATNVFILRDSGMIPYPIEWATLGDDGVISLDGPEMVAAFYGTGIAALRSVVGSGIKLKSAVNAASNANEVLAVEDSR